MKINKIIPRYLLVKTLVFLCGAERKNVNRTSFWTMLIALFTAVLLIYSYIQINGYRKSTNAMFIRELSTDFFTPETRQLIMLLEYNLLDFKENNARVDTIEGFPIDFGSFLIKKDYSGINKILLDSNLVLYSSYEMDDFILNKLDGIGGLEANGIVDIQDVYRTFYFYFDVSWNNPAIRKYNMWLSKRYPNQKFFKDLEIVYSKLKKYDKHLSKVKG